MDGERPAARPASSRTSRASGSGNGGRAPSAAARSAGSRPRRPAGAAARTGARPAKAAGTKATPKKAAAGKATAGKRPAGPPKKSTTAPRARRTTARPRGSRPGRRRVNPVTRVRRAWDRPLTAYYVVLGTGLLIILLGLVMVFSASQIQALRHELPAAYYFRKQLVAALLGAVLLLLATRIPLRLLRALTYPFLAFSVALLVLVQVPGMGVTVNGSTNWLDIGGPFMLQPAEFAKLALVLWGADLLARKREKRLLGQWRHLLIPLVPGALLISGLVLLGGDLGTVLVLTAVLLGLLWLVGTPTRLFVGALTAAVGLALFFITTTSYRMDRLACVMASEPGPEDRCWQAVHGIYALASGGWFGSGLGASVEKWGELPEPHTDFIFAITGEELGLAGTLSVVALFTALGYAGIRVAGRTEDPFVRYAAGGITTWLMAQFIINVGAVLGLLPITGVPLPLFSYGGSALLPAMTAVGLLIAFARGGDPAARAALATRRRPDGRRPPGLGWTSRRRRG